MNIECYARWRCANGCLFRDKTILKYGESWSPIANIILQNPGSSKSKDDATISSDEFEHLYKLVGINNKSEFKKGTIDPLMKLLAKGFSERIESGVIRIYNVFNLVKANSNDALNYVNTNSKNDLLFSKEADVQFQNQPIYFASGKSISYLKILLDKVFNYYDLSKGLNRVYLTKTGEKQFGFKTLTDQQSLNNDCYHLSYTCKYGNKTTFFNI